MLWVKEPLNKSSAERVADKIGMITRRTTPVLAWSTMPRSAMQWRPEAQGEGPREAGSTRVGDAATALMNDWAVHPAAGSHLPSEDTAPPFAVAPKASPEGAKRGSGSGGRRDREITYPLGARIPLLVATRSAGRGTREAGSTRVGDAATALMNDWAVHPAAGSYLPSEGTAWPFAVAFPSSPFAHSIPQSRRRARAGFIQRFLNLCITTTV